MKQLAFKIFMNDFFRQMWLSADRMRVFASLMNKRMCESNILIAEIVFIEQLLCPSLGDLVTERVIRGLFQRKFENFLQ